MNKYMPEAGSVIPVYLPQEIVRATVEKVVGEDSLIVRLDVTPPMAKSHSHHFGEYVAVMREPGELSGERWVAHTDEQISLKRALRQARA